MLLLFSLVIFSYWLPEYSCWCENLGVFKKLINPTRQIGPIDLASDLFESLHLQIKDIYFSKSVSKSFQLLNESGGFGSFFCALETVKAG